MLGFDFKDVRLNDSMLKSALDETMNFYLSMSNDSILKYMREAAGLPSPGVAYTGWYVGGKGMGSIGQWLSAYSRMYAITGNEAFKEKALFLSDELWKCIERTRDSERPLLSGRSFYAFEKLLQAQCDLHVYCGYPQAKQRALELVAFAKENLNTNNIFGDNGSEWYTLPESFYHAYETFGIEEAKEVGAQWEYREFWDLFYKDLDPFSKRPQAGLYSEYCHAYSHVNSFNSCAAAYETKNDPYYLRAMRKFYEFMKNTEMMATGGFGPAFEHLMPKHRVVDALRCGHDSFETQCGSYAVFRFVRYLTRFTGEPQFSDWIESLIYNATVATIPMTEDGKVIYYSDYNMYGAQKINRKDGWTCCTGTRPLVVPEMQRMLYFHEAGDLYVAQYTPSTLRWQRDGQIITVEQQTAFPLEDTASLRLSMAAPASFSIKLRMPAWLAGTMQVCVNGEPVQAVVDGRGWLSVAGDWKDGDTVSVALPQNVWMHSFDPMKQGPNAFLHGPVVLGAVYTGPQTPNDHMNVRRLPELMRPVEGKPLHYTVEGRDDLTFKPFYEFVEYERYFLYHDTSAHATQRFK